MDAHPPRGPVCPGPMAPIPAWRRTAWIWLAMALAGGAVVAGSAVWARMTTPTLHGGIVTPPAPTYDFLLRDQDHRPVRLSDFRGKAVVLTFLYAHCPDACPLTAEKLRQAYDGLGRTAQRVALVAVSVDPEGDTPDAVRGFLDAHRVRGELLYLTGTYPELKRVWSYYYINSDAKPGARAASNSPDAVEHTSIVYLIDPSGNLRVFLPGNFDPKDMVADLNILASGR